MTTRRKFISGVTAGLSAALASKAASPVEKMSSEKSFGTARGETITLGRTGIKTSRIGLGAAHFTTGKTKTESVRLVHAILDEGISLVDTAWNYGKDQASWRYLGEVFRERKRDEFIVSNKL